jgi:hypothetical protein
VSERLIAATAGYDFEVAVRGYFLAILGESLSAP